MTFGFLSAPQSIVPISTGPVGVPILYRQARSVLAVFRVKASAVSPLLEGTGLTPVPLFDGEPAVVVALFDYRDTSIGPYHEAAVATFVVPPGLPVPPHPVIQLLLPPRWRTVGLYIFDLPVTTQVANAAGRELWGLPKFVTEIPIAWNGDQFDAGVRDPRGGDFLFTLAGELTRGRSLPLRSLLLYSWLQRKLLRTVVDLRGWATAVRNPPLRLRVATRAHPMAERLVHLGLSDTSPLLAQVAPAFRARLNLGQSVGETAPVALAQPNAA